MTIEAELSGNEGKTMEALKKIVVGFGTCGLAAGSDEVYSAFRQQLDKSPVDVALTKAGCGGLCHKEVIVTLVDGLGKRSYANVTPDMVPRILQEDMIEGEPVEEWLFEEDPGSGAVGIVLRNSGEINPENIGDFLARGGYKALMKAVSRMNPESILAELESSGLRSRDLRGERTGEELRAVARSRDGARFVACDMTRADPGPSIDRVVAESDPHSIIEGLMLAAYATAAETAFIRCPEDYELAKRRLRLAVGQANERGILAGFPPVEIGVWTQIPGRAGWVAGAETVVNIPWIIGNGAEAFSALGTAESKGTKAFYVAGQTARCGPVEVAMGTTLRSTIFEAAGGMKAGSSLKAVQLGGPEGACLPESLLGARVCFESEAGPSTAASGGLVVADESACVADLAKFYMSYMEQWFLERGGESAAMTLIRETLERITNGEGGFEDLDRLGRLAAAGGSSSTIGPAVNQLRSTLRYFREEYERHVVEKHCPAAVCPKLIFFMVDEKTCTGCGVCRRVCEPKAISGKKREPYRIDQSACTRCGECVDACEFGAVIKV
ncbi:MAG: 4Fe-4S binding protein [Candidatus Aquicultorales bacterium]